MATREVRTSQDAIACAVCGRTLLRGERPHVYLDAGQPRAVCELCTVRATHEGWVREGTGEQGARLESREPRRPLRERLRTTRRERGAGEHEPLGEEEEHAEPAAAAPPRRRPERAVAEPASAGREPRHVRAVPSSHEQRIVAAVERFNASEHPRTIAGVARSLGPPVVAARPIELGTATVRITVSWELCWYRYEVDLADDGAGVRKVAQGYEPDELEDEDREPVAAADERGRLEMTQA